MQERINMIEHKSKYNKYSHKWFIELFLKHGSVEEALRVNKWQLPISPADYHRKISRHGIVKDAQGRNQVSIAEIVYFFTQKAIDPSEPLEELYRKMPSTFRPSVATLHRIYRNTIDRTIKRNAVGLVITPEHDFGSVLIVDEMSTRRGLGKQKGDSTIPFGFALSSKLEESTEQSVLRVLQHEFSTKLATSRELSNTSELYEQIVPKGIKPFMTFNILDLGVCVYHVKLPDELANLSKCSSYKVGNHRFIDASTILNGEGVNFREGVVEIVEGFCGYLASGEEVTIFESKTSSLNKRLASRVAVA